MVKLAISGKIASGKTTFAANICENEEFVKLSFASPIYDIARDYFGMTTKDRALLNQIGESCRAIDPHVWIKAFIKKAEELEAEGKSVVCDDLRTEDEHKALRDAGWFLVRLNVSEKEQERRIIDCYPKTYKEHLDRRNVFTEVALDHMYDWDIYFAEDVSKEVYNDSVVKLTTNSLEQN